MVLHSGSTNLCSTAMYQGSFPHILSILHHNVYIYQNIKLYTLKIYNFYLSKDKCMLSFLEGYFLEIHSLTIHFQGRELSMVGSWKGLRGPGLVYSCARCGIWGELSTVCKPFVPQL